VDAERHLLHITDGEELLFDLLPLAPAPFRNRGASALFPWPGDAAELEQMVEDALAGEIQSFVFAVPSGARWALPLYELALLTRARLVDAGAIGVRVTVVTPEDAPLELFGPQASAAIAELLEDRGIDLIPGTTPLAFADGVLSVAPGGSFAADRAVALPQLEGPRLRGLSSDPRGFFPTDPFGQVPARSTSGPPETPPASPSNRAGSRPSRPTPQPSRSRPASARSSSRARSVPCCVGCC
jgi:sulfide:quinone oxidoreductase